MIKIQIVIMHLPDLDLDFNLTASYRELPHKPQRRTLWPQTLL